MHDLVRSIAADVEQLTGALQGAGVCSGDLRAAVTSSGKQIAPPEDPLACLCDAVYGFVCGLGDEVPVSVRAVLLARRGGVSVSTPGSESDAPLSSEIAQGLGVLLMFVRNLTQQPLNVRYRRIASSNASFQKLLAPLQGHGRVLAALGFVKQGAHWELAEDNGNSGKGSAALLSGAVQLLEAAKGGVDAFLQVAAALLAADT
ncbi:hypothetical protein EON64_09290 [archaeon]|nr:MAG: hypothetical protein EON64_09290 [archaeon]